MLICSTDSWSNIKTTMLKYIWEELRRQAFKRCKFIAVITATKVAQKWDVILFKSMTLCVSISAEVQSLRRCSVWLSRLQAKFLFDLPLKGSLRAYPGACYKNEVFRWKSYSHKPLSVKNALGSHYVLVWKLAWHRRRIQHDLTCLLRMNHSWQESVGTLYGLIQTWLALPQAPQVGNLVPHHTEFDVTTPSGSICEARHFVSLLTITWFGARTESSRWKLVPKCAGITLRMRTTVQVVERSNILLDSPGDWSLCYHNEMFLGKAGQTLLQVQTNMWCFLFRLHSFFLDVSSSPPSTSVLIIICPPFHSPCLQSSTPFSVPFFIFSPHLSMPQFSLGVSLVLLLSTCICCESE